MPIIQKLDEDELALLEVLRNPIWFGEFVRNYELDEEDDPWVYTDYQKEFIADFNHFVSMACGRAVGKTISLIDKLVWYSVNNFWEETIVYTVPNKVHLDPVFLRITRWFRSHPFLKHFTGHSGINSQSFTIKLLNGAVIDCRIAGTSGTGANVIGLHIPIIIIDEAGVYPFGTYSELLPCLNNWQPGFQLIVSGVPTGVREKNVLYLADIKDPKFSKHRISAHRNPRYSEEDDKRNIKQFGGIESEEYIHMVLGEHGDAAYTLFERGRMLIQNYSIFRGTLQGQRIKKDPSVITKLYTALPALPKSASQVVFGIDLGYTEPTVIHLLYKTRNTSYWKFLFRLTLKQVSYPTQEKIIDYLDSLYSPGMIAIDEGSAGKAVVQHLISDPTYKHKDFKNRVIPIGFNSNIAIGLDDDGKEIEVRAKQFGMQLLQSKVNNHDICFSWSDETMISELERTTYRKNARGDLSYRTLTPHGGTRHGEDHNTAALLCMVIGIYLKEEASQFLWRRKVNLYKPRWFRT